MCDPWKPGFGNLGLQRGVMVSSRRISCACSKAKYEGKRRVGCKRSGRCTTIYHRGKLRRGGVRQYVQGQGVFHLFVRMSQCCLAGRYVRNLFARSRGQSGALNCQGVCALGVARARADAPQFVMGAPFGEAAVAGFNKGKVHLLVLGNFARLPCSTMFLYSDCHSSWSK